MDADIEVKDRLNVYLPARLKRRIKLVAKDKKMKMNDIVIDAVSDYLDRQDASYSSPDLVFARLSEVLNSNMALVAKVNQLDTKVSDIDRLVDQIQALTNLIENGQ